MTLKELNNYLDKKYGAENAIHVSEIVYPDVEELYNLSSVAFDKWQLADFYQEFDYIGIINALEIMRNFDEFKKEIIESVITDKEIYISPSQLKFINLAYPMLLLKVAINFKVDCPWKHYD